MGVEFFYSIFKYAFSSIVEVVDVKIFLYQNPLFVCLLSLMFELIDLTVVPLCFYSNEWSVFKSILNVGIFFP